ncbi:hypothetical protein HHI36_021288 [Cryptolaemus montrouzieri]|uniref:C2H2-type domain-containing protein n=1 Tax=Cryptolaemus montrouzieri TaxID=559131 RepID=A0ABD2MXC9_9CUCU
MRICNRLFKEEKQAIEHLQKCKPRIYLLSKEELTNGRNENEYRDPYEIIPEELDLEGKINNNNSLKHNRNGGVNSKWTERHRRLIVQNEKGKYKRNQITNNNETINNVDKDVNISIVQDSNEVAMRNDEDATKHSTPTKKPPINRGKRKNKKLTEEEIKERLRKISEKLKTHKQSEARNEDDEEEEQRRAIEDRLSSLNKDSEVCFFNEDDVEDRLKEEESLMKALVTEEQMDLSTGEMSVTLQASEEAASSSESSFSDKIITEVPDGELHDCKECSEVFFTAVELFRHKKMKHTYPRIKMAPDEVNKHINIKDRSHCPICGRPINSRYKSIYVKHVQTHSWLAEHECPTCKKKFRRKDQMKKHAKRHIV